MKTIQRTRIAEVHFCEICGRRIAGVEVITTGTKLCSDCDKLTTVRRASSRRSSRKRMVCYENRFWLVMGLVAFTFVLLIVAILMPSRRSQLAAAETSPSQQVSSTFAVQVRPELQSKSVAAIASTLASTQADGGRAAPAKRRNPDMPDSTPPAPTPPTTPAPTPPTTPSVAPKPVATPPAQTEPSVADLLNKPQSGKKPSSDDSAAAENKTPAQSAATSAPVTPPTADSARPAAPKAAASAASAAPAAKPAPAAEAPKAAEEFEAFDVARKKAYARLVEGDAPAARRIFEQQRNDPALQGSASVLDDELALVDDVDRVQQALPAGLKQLDSRKVTSLSLTNGRAIALSAKCAVTSVKDDVLEVEETFAGASVTRKINISQLSAQTRYEVAAQALPATPASSLTLASAAYVFLRSGTCAVPLSEFKARLEAARKDAALAPRADRLLELFTTAQKERAIDAALKKITDAIKGKLPGLARNLLRDFKRDYAVGDVPPNIQEFIDKTTFELAEVKQGLWASFFSGAEENPMQKYLFSREEAKLNFAWGQASPDPRVPNDCFGIRFHGLLRVTTPGTYVFWASADDTLELAIDGKHILVANWVPDGEGGKTGSIKLTTGDHDLKVTFKEIFVDATMHVKWRLDSEKSFQEIPPAVLWYDPKLVERYQKDIN